MEIVNDKSIDRIHEYFSNHSKNSTSSFTQIDTNPKAFVAIVTGLIAKGSERKKLKRENLSLPKICNNRSFIANNGSQLRTLINTKPKLNHNVSIKKLMKFRAYNNVMEKFFKSQYQGKHKMIRRSSKDKINHSINHCNSFNNQ